MNRSRMRFAFWIVIILCLVVPWARFEPHAHWERATWVPFLSRPIVLRDMVLNTLLYVPFGYWHAKHSTRPIWYTAAYALLLSVGTELTQVFSYTRFPSTTDIVCNVAGAAVGHVWSAYRR